ncbi:MAG: hypothetical protein RIQ33_1095 [Bacteroidota bacterium]|jgi:hypothetical protein
MYKIIFGILISIFTIGCSSNNQPTTVEPAKPDYTKLPQFNEDSCYQFVAKQVSFGVRIPNTTGHINCGNYLENYFKKMADTVYLQNTTVQSFDGKQLKIKNIIASFLPEQKGNRLLICAHWDSRPFADQETDLQKMKQPILAADDAGSGVAVMMELARIFHQQKPDIGIDLVMLDAEDYGCPSPGSPLLKGEYNENSYCLGTQYWCRNPHVVGYQASAGILLDMVGAKGATFALENVSMQNAPGLMNEIWTTANALGFAGHFINQPATGITDDHTYINGILHIPTIDIIYHDLNGQKWFAPHWHTLNDNMNIIDKSTLKAVGQTLVGYIYKSKIE